jgi:hypothetical protein
MNCPTCSFTWSDHTPVDFEVWRYGEPNNSGGVDFGCKFFYYKIFKYFSKKNFYSQFGCPKFSKKNSILLIFETKNMHPILRTLHRYDRRRVERQQVRRAFRLSSTLSDRISHHSRENSDKLTFANTILTEVLIQLCRILRQEDALPATGFTTLECVTNSS